MSLKQRQIIGITWYSASGKSILAQALRAEFGMGVFFSLGDHQRKRFAAYGSPLIYLISQLL